MLWVASWVSLLIVVGVWAFEHYVGERHWLGALVSFMPQAPFVVLPVLLLALGALARRPDVVVVNLVAVGWTCCMLMGLRVPLWFPEQAPGRPFRVLTYNIHCGLGGSEPLVRAIRDADPDVVCLQEVTPFRGGADPARDLIRELSDYQFGRVWGIATLTKSRSVQTRIIPLGRPREGRPALLTTLEVEGRRVTIVNVHVMKSDSRALHAESLDGLAEGMRRAAAARTSQVDTLLEICSDTSGPVIVAGDFNTPPGTNVYRSLSQYLQDAHAVRGLGFGYTFVSTRPLVRIDFLWASPEWSVQSCRALSLTASDHRPVVADFRLRAAE